MKTNIHISNKFTSVTHNEIIEDDQDQTETGSSWTTVEVLLTIVFGLLCAIATYLIA